MSVKLDNLLDCYVAQDDKRRAQLQALHEHARLCRFVALVADMMPDGPEAVLYVTAKRAAERDEARIAACGTVDEERMERLPACDLFVNTDAETYRRRIAR